MHKESDPQMKDVRVMFLTRYGKLGASSRMRTLQFIPWLKRAGMVCTVVPFIDDSQLQYKYKHGKYSFLHLLIIYWNRISTMMKLRNYDLVWVEKEALPWLPAWFEVMVLRRAPYVLDYDDAIFHGYDKHKSFWVRYLLGHRIDRLMASSELVVAGNAYLARRAQDAGARWVEIIPTVVDLNRYTLKSNAKASNREPLRIVWIGSPSTMKFLMLMHEPLKKLSEKFRFKFRVVAGSSIDLPGVDVEFVPWTHSTEAASIQACDIGVMPLVDSDWERGKCGYKLIQYMACGLPVVASAVGANCEIVDQGENGFLVETQEEWVGALSKLLADAPLRYKMGEAGRKRVESEYCVQKAAPKLVRLLNRAALSESR